MVIEIDHEQEISTQNKILYCLSNSSRKLSFHLGKYNDISLAYTDVSVGNASTREYEYSVANGLEILIKI